VGVNEAVQTNEQDKVTGRDGTRAGSRWARAWAPLPSSRRRDARRLKVLELSKARRSLKEVFWVRGGAGEGERASYLKKPTEKCSVRVHGTPCHATCRTLILVDNQRELALTTPHHPLARRAAGHWAAGSPQRHIIWVCLQGTRLLSAVQAILGRKLGGCGGSSAAGQPAGNLHIILDP
jgi:hypothetical protein